MPAQKLVAEANRAETETALQAGRRGRGRSGGSFRSSRGSGFRSHAAAARSHAATARGDRATAGRSGLTAARVATATIAAVVVAVVTTAGAAAAIIHRAAASRGITAAAAVAAISAATAIAAVTGQNLVLTAHQGDADDREKNRDAKQQCTIHPKFLQQNRYRTVRDSTTRPSLPNLFPPRDGRRKGGTFGQVPRTQLRRGCPVSSLLRLRVWTQMHRLGCLR